MILLRENICDPIHSHGEERIKSCDDAKPPWDHKRAARMFGDSHHALRDIFRRHVWVFDSLDRFARFRSFEFFTELCDCGTGINARNFYAEVTHLAAQRVGKRADAVFTGGIRCDRWRGDQPRHRRHVDDVTFAAFEHVRQDGARDEHRADEVDLDQRFDIAFGFEILEPVDGAVARVVEENIYVAIEIERGLHHHVNFGALGNIHRDGKRFAALALNFCREGLQSVESASGEDDSASFCGKKFRGIRAESRRCAGDEDYFVFEGDGHGSLRNTQYAIRGYCVLRTAYFLFTLFLSLFLALLLRSWRFDHCILA